MKDKQGENSEWRVDEMFQSPISNLQSHRLVSVSREAPGVSPRLFLRLGLGEPRIFWQDAQMESGRFPLTFAGFGIAANLFAWGESRFRQIEQQARALFADAVMSDAGQALSKPRLFGGFSFRDDFAPDNTWSVHQPAHFILPHYQLVRVGQATWLTINTLVPRDEDVAALLPALEEALEARYVWLQQQADVARGEETAVSPNYQIRYPLSKEAWASQIQAAKDAMASTPLNKVVLSRVAEIRLPNRVNVDASLDYLQTEYANCFRFLFEPRPYHAFFGATPELLARVNGTSLTTMALAGSIGRGKNRVEDELLAQELQRSSKDRREHAIVVDSIQRRLQPLTSSITIPAEPAIYRLHNIQHLYTPIAAKLNSAAGILPVVETLHPTPALGGSPRELAMAFIQQAEPVPRGWYAAPVGWIDAEMDGQFTVAIRSAVAQEKRVWLYAGAGIVADSDPEKEWQETGLKFRPMMEALGLADENLLP